MAMYPETDVAAPGMSIVRHTVLDNGLNLLVQEVHTAPLASVWCWYKVGSKDEGRGLTGVSHWVEHMNFKGTRNIPRDQVKGIIERFGGTWNGYTWIDQTAYLETASRDALDRMLFIEAERMSACLYEPDDCESERTVIISELKGGENDPEQLLDIDLTAAAFRVHPYQHPTIGWLQDLERMTRDDVYGHYLKHYIPNNATLVVVGDVDADEVVRRVDHHFGQIPSGPAIVRPEVAEPPQRAERRVHFRKEGTTAYWRAAWHGPAVSDPDFFPMLFVDAVLTGASGLNIWSGQNVPTPQRSSRLYRALVDSGVATNVGGIVLPTQHPFLYYVWATVADGQSLRALEEVALSEIDRLVKHGVTEAELDKVRAQLRARFVYDSDSVTAIAHQLGYFETVDRWQTYTGLLPRLSTVGIEDVNRVAQKFLTQENRTIAWFEPCR
jgi:zinc protease